MSKKRVDAYAACGECPEGQCDGCKMCDYFVELAASYRGPAGRLADRRRVRRSGK